MSNKRRRFQADFKAKVALEAIKCEKKVSELAGKYQIPRPLHLTKDKMLIEYAIVIGIIGFLIGFFIAWIFMKSKISQEIAKFQTNLATSEEKVRGLEDKRKESEEQLTKAHQQIDANSETIEKLRSERDTLSVRLEEEQKQTKEKLAILNEAKEVLSNQFKSLASDILEEKSKRFTEQNKTNLDQLLNPLKTKIQEFQGKVEEVYVNEGKDRSALAEQVRNLITLNQTLSADTNNLTQALKGSSKIQGNWGEIILERILETSGLRKGEEYETQTSHNRKDGSRAIPDAVIFLPDNRQLVVDAKMSLTAYESYHSTASDEERNHAIKQHLDSVRKHIYTLSDKNYHELDDLKTVDFTIMFVPIEPAYLLAISEDQNLFMEAYNRNVMLVCPSTFLFVVRTIAHIWRQDSQNKNALEIAKRGAELYDKIVGFVSDFEQIGTRLKQAQDTYDSSIRKLSTGRGNVIRQAEMLKELGVKPSKNLPDSLTAYEDEEDETARLENKNED